jgi:hypothetical protein
VICTAPTHRQIRSILWREIRALYHGAKIPLGGELHELPEIGLQYEDGREIVGFYTTEPEKMAGISGPNVLFIVDEASGIPVEIYEAIEGNRAGGAGLVLFSNPTQTSGEFFDAFHTKRSYWTCIHVSSVEAAETGIPGLATKAFIDEKRREWGEASPLYQVRIEGNFPSQAENSVIPLVDVEAALARHDSTHDEATLTLGVDVARFGDDASIIFPVRGKKAFAPIKLQGKDNVQVAGAVMDVARRLRFGSNERVRVNVDVIGVGAGVADQLRDRHQAKEIVLAEVNVAEKASSERFQREYANLRSELWFNVAAWLRSGGAIPRDGELEGELVAPLYTFDLKGRRKVEAKDDLKKRLGRSPDKADALALAVHSRPVASFSASVIRSRYGHDEEDETPFFGRP